MTFSVQSFEEKPYNMCLNCSHIGKDCDGPNFLAMSGDRWSEWCRLRKDYLGWTNAMIAERAQIAKISVDRALSGNTKDMRITTVQAITKALVNGSWGQYPCAMPPFRGDENMDDARKDLAQKAEEAEKTIEKLNADHAATVDHLTAQIEFLRTQIIAKDNQITEKDNRLKERYDFLVRKDNIMKGLVAALSVCLIAVIVLIAV